MVKRCWLLWGMLCWAVALEAQSTDSSMLVGKKIITLSPVIVNNRVNVPGFIERIRTDTSFYKAFKNLRILGFTAINDVRMLSKSNELKAHLHSKTKQYRQHQCRKMQVLEETHTGDVYNEAGGWNYYTLEMYASLFFTRDSVCGETNVVQGADLDVAGKKGMEKHKQQLKKLFFNPGARIEGLPFMSNKTAIFDDRMADRYEMDLNMDVRNGISCFVFHQKAKPGSSDGVVIDEMTTWFNDSTMEVVARKYHLSYDAAVYDFDVNMEVEMGRFRDLTVPVLIRYTGNWKALFKRRERGVFTATLFDFEQTD